MKFNFVELFLVDQAGIFFFCFFFVCLASFLLGFVSFIWVLLKSTLGTLDCGIAVHTSAGTPMCISWTLGLRSSTDMQTNNQVHRMIHVY